jgi:hypothetical protein
MLAIAIGLLTIVFWPRMLGQTTKTSPDVAKPDDPIGNYFLVTTVLRSSPTTHLLNPPITLAVDGGTERVPGEFSGTKPVSPEMGIEAFGMPRYECTATNPKLRGCDALDRTYFTIRDPNTIGYHIVSHGGAVTLSINVEVHDILPVSQATPNVPWHAREMIFVAVPKATPALRFVSEVLIGEWNGEPIVFEVGKTLPDTAKQGLEDLGVKQDLGDRVLYSFRVKELPKK